MKEEIETEFQAELAGKDYHIQAMADLHGKEMVKMESKPTEMASQNKSDRKAANEVRISF